MRLKYQPSAQDNVLHSRKTLGFLNDSTVKQKLKCNHIYYRDIYISVYKHQTKTAADLFYILFLLTFTTTV